MSGIKYYSPFPIVGLGLDVSSMVYAVEGFGVEVLLNKRKAGPRCSIEIGLKNTEDYAVELSLLNKLVDRFVDKGTNKWAFDIKTNLLFKYLSFIDVFPSIVAGVSVACNDAVGKPFERREIFNIVKSTFNYDGDIVFWNKLACCLIGGLVLGNQAQSITDYRRISMPYGFCSIGLYFKDLVDKNVVGVNFTEQTVVDALNLCFSLDRSDFSGFEQICSNSLKTTNVLSEAEQLFVDSVVDKGGGYFLRPSNQSQRALVAIVINDFIGTEVLAEFDKKTKENTSNSGYKAVVLKHNLEGVYRL